MLKEEDGEKLILRVRTRNGLQGNETGWCKAVQGRIRFDTAKMRRELIEHHANMVAKVATNAPAPNC